MGTVANAFFILAVLIFLLQSVHATGDDADLDEVAADVDGEGCACVCLETEKTEALEDETEANVGHKRTRTGGRVRGRTWDKLPAGQANFCRSLRSTIDAGGAAAVAIYRHGYVIHPSNPVFAHLDESFDPSLYAVVPVGFWDPPSIWPKLISTMPCPHCGSHKHVCPPNKAKWKDVPRWVTGFKFSWLLDTKSYTCSCCKKSFRTSHPDSIARLPPIARASFGIFLAEKVGVDVDVAMYALDHWAKFGAAAVARTLNRWHMEYYHFRHYEYYAGLAALKEAKIAVKSSDSSNIKTSLGGDIRVGDYAKQAFEEEAGREDRKSVV